MNTNLIQPKRALISVSNKTGIVEFAKELSSLGVEIISTGGTYKTLTEVGIPAIEISKFTGFPEMMDGRVKTLHPLVHAGILGLRDRHSATAQEHNIKWIDLVVVNLYPFSQTIQKPNVTEDEAIENIDIGGPTMIRSAAKNVGWVGVVVDPNDYTPLLEEIKSSNGLSVETRKKLSAKAFGHTAQYDAIIYNYFCPLSLRGSLATTEAISLSKDSLSGGIASSVAATLPPRNDNVFPPILTLTFNKFYDLRYGENPHQLACVYKEPNNTEVNILNAKIHQGKQLSYNNINDADGALALTREFAEPACVVVKHANPCGVAVGNDITEVFKRAYNADALSAFGGIISLNRTCTKQIAEEIAKVFAEIVLAPSFEPEALTILATKKNLRVLELGTFTSSNSPVILSETKNLVGQSSELDPSLPLRMTSGHAPKKEYRFVDGGLLVQDRDTNIVTREQLKVVTEKQPTEEQINTMLFAWKVLKYMKSNAILVAKDNTTVGVGVGQVSRVDAVDIAIKKATQSPSGAWQAGDKITGSILASDAFFPFRDSIDKIAKTGITAIIQPGGSIKDEEVIKACNEYGIAMVFTGVRCFKH